MVSSLNGGLAVVRKTQRDMTDSSFVDQAAHLVEQSKSIQQRLIFLIEQDAKSVIGAYVHMCVIFNKAAIINLKLYLKRCHVNVVNILPSPITVRIGKQFEESMNFLVQMTQSSTELGLLFSNSQAQSAEVIFDLAKEEMMKG